VNHRKALHAVFGFAVVIIGVAATAARAGEKPAPDDKGAVRFAVRSQDKTETRELRPDQTAIVICDVWNKHWCASATRRCDAIARKIAPLVEQARSRGMLIVHSPSDTLDFYRDHPARKRALEIAKVEPPLPIEGWCVLDKKLEVSLPIDDSDGGCDCQPQCKNYKAWNSQHPAIRVDDADFVSDDGKEVYSYLASKRVKNLIYVGVHTNMCVLGRSFGIRQMTRLGFNTMLVRDLTDTMYNPRMSPFVEHDQGTDLVVRHVERFWCPTLVAAALAEGIR
jgi:nicotinamidase-related amidase